MAAGIRAIRAYEASLRAHDEIGTGVPAPPEFLDLIGSPELRLAKTVVCRSCRAQPGERCHHRATKQPMPGGYHPERLDAARAARQSTEGES